MFYPYGFGGSSWLIYIGVPLIIGLWAQFRVSSAFRKWGEVRASSNISGAECAREILQAQCELAARVALIDVCIPAADVRKRDLKADARFNQLRDLQQRIAEGRARILRTVLRLVLRWVDLLQKVDGLERLLARALQ